MPLLACPCVTPCQTDDRALHIRERLPGWRQLQRCAAPLAAALLLQASPARAAEVIQGPARAVDGDTLVVSPSGPAGVVHHCTAQAHVTVHCVLLLPWVTSPWPWRHSKSAVSHVVAMHRWPAPGCVCTAWMRPRPRRFARTAPAVSMPAVTPLTRAGLLPVLACCSSMPAGYRSRSGELRWRKQVPTWTLLLYLLG